MYIPSIVITIIVIVLTIFWESSREKERDKLQAKYENERMRSKEEWKHQYELYIKEQDKLKTIVVATVFDCSIDEAKEKYCILKQTYNDSNFLYADSNRERKEIYDQALTEFQGK